MKYLKTIFAFVFFFIINLNDMPGEVYFKIKNGTTSNNFSVRLNTTSYFWLYNDQLKKVVLGDNSFYPHNYTSDVQYKFESPKDAGVNTYIMPWGLMEIRVTFGQNEINFIIDFRDRDWATNDAVYSPRDLYIFINHDSGKIFYGLEDNNIVEEITNGSQYKVWELWGYSLANQAEFTVPVTMKNRIENQTFAFGQLKANNITVASDSLAYLRFFDVNQVEHLTMEINYNNQRNYSFKWVYNYITSEENQNIYSSSNYVNTTKDLLSKEVERRFRSVYPLTVKNLIPEKSNITEGEIYFKDPITDNQFNLYSAAGNGFIKNEAFTGLDEDVNGLLHQKYAVKAKQSFTASGINYNWYEGDFNPSTQFDFMVTGITNLNAKYKGNLVSNYNSGFSTNSQRKVVKTDDGKLHIVYESLDKVWYTYSIDNGVTWQPEQLVDIASANTKNASLTHNSNAIFIAYQSNEGPRIKAARFSNGQRSWITNVYSLSSYDYDARPVIAAYSSEGALIVFKPTSTSQLRRWLFRYESDCV